MYRTINFLKKKIKNPENSIKKIPYVQVKNDLKFRN